jgi:hypothetical protein
MRTTARITSPPMTAGKSRNDGGPAPPGSPSAGEMVVEAVSLIAAVVVAGPPAVFVFASVVLLALAVAGPFVLIATAGAAVLLVLTAAAVLMVLTRAALAAPLLLVRRLRGRRRRRLPIAGGKPAVQLRSALRVASHLTSTPDIQRSDTP